MQNNQNSIIPLGGTTTALIATTKHWRCKATLAWYYANESSAVLHAYLPDGTLVGRLYVRPNGTYLFADDANLEPNLLLCAVPLEMMDQIAKQVFKMLYKQIPILRR